MGHENDSGIDYEGLIARVEGDEAFAKELLRLFVADVPTKLDRIRDAIAAGNRVAVEKGAHSLKGTSATVKAGALERSAHQLELSAHRDSDCADWRRLLEDLAREFETIRTSPIVDNL